MSECPVCGKGGVDEEAARCPQCHADLECFALLDALHEGELVSPPEPRDLDRGIAPARENPQDDGASRGAHWGWPLVLVTGLILSILVSMLVLQVLALRKPPAAPLVAAQVREPDSNAATLQDVLGGMARLTDRLETLEGQLRALGTEQATVLEQMTAASRQVGKLAALVQRARDAPVTAARPPTPGTPIGEAAPEPALHYQLRPGDTLWSIARRYYGHGWLYPVLIAQNPGLGVYHQGTGTLSLFASPARALELYHQITPPGAEGQLFRYQVQPGDDWRGLARRFLGGSSRAPELMALNPSSDLAPGSRILIPLE